MKDLTARYGPEGATAMAAILAMPRKLTQRRGHASKEDLAAVAALDMVEVRVLPTCALTGFELWCSGCDTTSHKTTA